jgi:hypothetical protein
MQSWLPKFVRLEKGTKFKIEGVEVELAEPVVIETTEGDWRLIEAWRRKRERDEARMIPVLDDFTEMAGYIDE